MRIFVFLSYFIIIIIFKIKNKRPTPQNASGHTPSPMEGQAPCLSLLPLKTLVYTTLDEISLVKRKYLPKKNANIDAITL